MIFPVKTEVQPDGEGGVMLAFYDHPKRRALEDVNLTYEQSRELLNNLARALYPDLAEETLAHLP